MTFKIYSFIVIYLCFKSGFSQRNGDPCYHNGAPGQFSLLRDCQSALANPATRSNLKSCGFDGRESIICCPDRSAANPVATPAPKRRRSPAAYAPPMPEYEYFDTRSSAKTCAPISDKLTTQKTGSKAWDKCIEYQEQLLYPCERGVDFLGKLSRGNHCNHKADELIIGGTNAQRNEFPHMALLGFERPLPNDPICGGTIISEKFILTAGHCTSTQRAKVSTAKVGMLHYSEAVPESRVYRVKRIIKHPQFKPPSKYNDIALLETDRTITFGPSVIPACLHTGEQVDDSQASATGWGDTARHGSKTDVLLKVTLEKFDASACKRQYPTSRRFLPHGFDAGSQMCYGDHNVSRDTCQGDSGGPLQINNVRIHCMYTVIGVTSYGDGCGKVGKPAVYTRVANYINWIESVVWPQ